MLNFQSCTDLLKTFYKISKCYLPFNQPTIWCGSCWKFLTGSLKGSKSQKHFFLKLHHCPQKRTKYLTKFCPSFIEQNFVSFFVCFLGNGVSRKNAFENYWPLECCCCAVLNMRLYEKWKPTSLLISSSHWALSMTPLLEHSIGYRIVASFNVHY